jgi:excisionase family DNA binding protein
VSVVAPDGSVTLTPLESALFLLTEQDVRARWRRDGFIPDEVQAALWAMRTGAAIAHLSDPPHRGVVPVVSQAAAFGFADPELVMTVQEAAKRLEISQQAVRKAARRGHLDGSRTGGAWEITAESVDRYVPRSRPSEGEAMTDSEFQAVKAELLDLQAEIEQIEADVRDLAVAS